VHDIEVKRHLSPEDLAAVAELLAAASEVDAHPALGEHAWLDLVQGGREGFAGLVAWEPGHPHPVGYAQLSLGPHGAGAGEGVARAGQAGQGHPLRGPEPGAGTGKGVPGRPAPGKEGLSWALEVVVDPHHRVPGNTVAIDLVRSALGLIAKEGGGHLHLWVNRPGPFHDRLAAAAGLSPGRALYQMTRSLPFEEHATISTRPFEVGHDEADWLKVNNRAFAWHPEQGGWTEETLKAREAQPWFDPEGFRLYEVGGRLAGFCWTKIHRRANHPPTGEVAGVGEVGEIYVVAVDPDFAGQGLGRQLTLAGLDYLSSKGISQAVLYVDATNLVAVKMYVDLGFTVNHIDRAYTGDIAPAP
jgi:mycothiol synthase